MIRGVGLRESSPLLIKLKGREWELSLQKSDDPLEWKFSRGPLRGQPMFKVDPETKCWIWQGGRDRGYGRIQIMARLFPGIKLGSKTRKHDGWLQLWVHQLTYFMRRGNPGKGKEIDHTCLRRCCANPDHLVARTPTENKAGRYQMPELTQIELDAITEKLLEKYPNNWISENFGISIWAVRKVAENMQMQLDLTLEETPF